MAYVTGNSPIQNIRVISIQGVMDQLWRGATFLMVLNGEVQADVDGHVTFMNKGDLQMVEPSTPYRLSGRGSNLLMLVQMDYDFFCQCRSPQRRGQIICNSAEDKSRDYAVLRQMLSYLGLTYFGSDDTKELRIHELCYSLLYILSTSFFLRQTAAEGEVTDLANRGRHVVAFVESNYMNEIQLEDLSRAEYLSPSYLSRLFKKLTGTNFKSYLEEVRLRHATEELRTTDKTITAIAYNNGFPNVSALSTAIRKKYDMAPNEYRQMLQSQEAEAPTPPSFQELAYSQVAEELHSLAGAEPPKAMGIFSFPVTAEYTVENASPAREIPNLWQSMINLGPADTLMENNIADQLHLVQNEIGFRYARIENLLSEAAVPSVAGGGVNFSRLFRLMSLLSDLKLIPFLDLSFPGDKQVSTRSRSLFRGDTPRARESEVRYLNKVSELMRRSINTFGARAVEQWCVEICVAHDEDLNPLESPEDFCRRFIQTYRILKAMLPNIKIGGPGYHIAGPDDFITETARILKQENVRADFFSLCAVPYEATQGGDRGVSHIISSNPYYIRDCVRRLREVTDRCFSPELPLYVTVLAPDIRTRNSMNDACYQSVFFVKNTVDLIGLAQEVGYWQFSDLCSEFSDTSRMFFGGTGIVSKDGLKKPGFAALKRMSWLEPLLVHKEDGMLLTTNGVNSYTMLLYNYAHFNNLYCLSNGEDTTIDNVYTMFDSPATRDVAIHLGGLRPGRYRVVINTINRESGSIFDEWLRYGLLDEPQPYDIRYLRDITHPSRAVSFWDCPQGRLDLNLQMAPHEVKCLRIFLVV